MRRQTAQAALWDEAELEKEMGRVYVGLICRWTHGDLGYPQFACDSCLGTTSDIPIGLKRIYRAPNEPKKLLCCACFKAF